MLTPTELAALQATAQTRLTEATAAANAVKTQMQAFQPALSAAALVRESALAELTALGDLSQAWFGTRDAASVVVPMPPPTPAIWRELAIIAPVLAIPNVANGTAPQNFIDSCRIVAEAFPGHIKAMSAGMCEIDLTVVISTIPVTRSKSGYSVMWDDLPEHIAAYQAGTFDHVSCFIDRMLFPERHAGLSTAGVPKLTSASFSFLAGYAMPVAEAQKTTLYVHEWLHGCLWFMEAASGRFMPNIDRAGDYGYVDEKDGWRRFMADVLTGKIPGVVKGIGAAGWALGTPSSYRARG